MSKDILTQLMAFTYSLAHYIGQVIITGILYIFPTAKGLQTLADPVGYLSVLTLFVILTATLKKVGIIVLLAGWALILIRIVLMAIGI